MSNDTLVLLSLDVLGHKACDRHATTEVTKKASLIFLTLLRGDNNHEDKNEEKKKLQSIRRHFFIFISV